MGNSSACLFKNNKLIFAIEEERITRIKNDSSFPHNSIQACLNYEKINISNINEICVYWRPFNLFTRVYQTIKIFLFNFNFFKVLVAHIFSFFFFKNKHQSGKWSDLFFIKKIFKKKYNYKGSILFFDHHLCHALSAYIVSDKKNALCISFDGGGESESTVVYKFKNSKILKLNSVNWPNSLGHFYSFFTGFLGFKMLEGEYKMMGLAPYGKPLYLNLLSKIIKSLPDNRFYKFDYLNVSYHLALYGLFGSKFKKIFGNNRKIFEKLTKKDHNLACSVQIKFEEIFDNIISYYKKILNLKKYNLLISGGCALNVSNNGKILEKNIFKKIFVPPAPHDAGAAIGACVANLIKNHKQNLKSINFESPYLGNSYHPEQIKKILDKNYLIKYKFLEFDEIFKKIALKLSKKEIIAWFQGRSEFGPRALGNRSFLADPRSEKIRTIINKKIKKRELFRPFAPSCLEEDKNIYFEIKQNSPYMNFTCKVKKEAQHKIPAVVHIDKTVRLHTVNKRLNFKYWKLIREFKNITGVGVLLNTSFNIQEPIVETPEDAVNCFLKSNVDYLVIENFLINKK